MTAGLGELVAAWLTLLGDAPVTVEAVLDVVAAAPEAAPVRLPPLFWDVELTAEVLPGDRRAAVETLLRGVDVVAAAGAGDRVVVILLSPGAAGAFDVAGDGSKQVSGVVAPGYRPLHWWKVDASTPGVPYAALAAACVQAAAGPP